MAERIDLDELARLEEERSFLLRSIADLDREHAAGDVDDLDYAELRTGYMTRAAATLHEIDDRRNGLTSRRGNAGRTADRAGEAEGDADGETGGDTDANARRGSARTAAWVVGLLGFATVAGLFMASAVGSRGANDQITGTGAMPESPSAECRAIRFDRTEEIATCWDGVLAEDPDDPEALTYGGWAKVRGGDVSGGSAMFDRVVASTPDYPDVFVFRASVAKNAGDFAGAQRALDTLYALNPSPVVISTLQTMNLDTEIAEGLLPPATNACWKDERAALEALSVAATGDEADDARAAVVDLVLSLDCLDKVLVTSPNDVDAMLLQAVGLGVLDDADAVAKAQRLADRALEVAPGSPNALLVRSAILTKVGNAEAALADLDALGSQRTSPLYSLIDRAAVRSQAESDSSDG